MGTDAQAVVIGGGVAGCSIAYHLARLGWRDVVLVEQHDLTEGTTWHSAGFVGQLRSTISQTKMTMYSSGLYAELAEATGMDAGWRGVGGLRLATTPQRVEELHRQAAAATTYGLDMEMLTAEQARERLPILDVSDVLAAAWLPGDGWLDPAKLTRAFAEGARRLGVQIRTGLAVIGLQMKDGRVAGVETNHGPIRTEVIVNAAGAAAPAVGRLAGVHIPIVAMKHQYVVTDPLNAPPRDGGMPTVRDPDNIVYFREEEGGLLVGGYVRHPQVWQPAGTPLSSPRTLFEEDMGKFAESWESARRRVPALEETAITKVIHGPEAFTPDGEFVLGETEVPGFWVAAGFCVHGLAAAGGVGKVMAEWIVEGMPEYDVAHMDVHRFAAHARSPRWVRTKALDSYSAYYDIVYPGEERTAARPLRRSSVYPRLTTLEAEFGEKAGWERPNWFESNAARGDERLRPRGWAGMFWSPAIQAECLATRDTAALFDQSSFAKLDVRGPGARPLLDRLCANRIDKSVGSVSYTQLLNPRGGIEADLTVTRLGEDRFRVVTGTAHGGRNLAWIRAHAPADGSVQTEDMTSAYACFCLWGPKAGEILRTLTDANLTNDAFPFMKARLITVGWVPVLAQRVTFVGELGWELYCPTDYGLTLWDTLKEAGQPHGIIAGGYRAIDALRLEKGYRVWGSDVTPETTPDEAGLSFAVRIDKPGGFIGREALLAQRDNGGPTQRLRCLVLDDFWSVCLGSEPVRADGVPVGRVTSGGHGYRLQLSLAYAYLPAAMRTGDRIEINVFGRWVGAEIAAEPLYDPKGLRIRGEEDACEP